MHMHPLDVSVRRRDHTTRRSGHGKTLTTNPRRAPRHREEPTSAVVLMSAAYHRDAHVWMDALHAVVLTSSADALDERRIPSDFGGRLRLCQWMQTSEPLAPEDLLTVSPVVAQVVAELFADQPSLSGVREVQLAILGVTFRYVRQLGGAVGPAPKLGPPERRRALLFLMNTSRPLPSAPETSAADLFVAASNKISSDVPEEPAASRAFEHAIASIVHIARIECAVRARWRAVCGG